MAKLIRGEKQYALVINQDEADFLRALLSRVSNSRKFGQSPDWPLFEALDEVSSLSFTQVFNEAHVPEFLDSYHQRNKE